LKFSSKLHDYVLFSDASQLRRNSVESKWCAVNKPAVMKVTPLLKPGESNLEGQRHE
jgi:hypothetical protein